MTTSRFSLDELLAMQEASKYMQKPIRCPNWITKEDADKIMAESESLKHGLEGLFKRGILFVNECGAVRDEMLDLSYKLQLHQEGAAESIMADNQGKMWDNYHSLNQREINSMMNKGLKFQHDEILFHDVLTSES